MKTKFLITGGAGFIGSHLTGKLLEKDEKVAVIDNLDSYYPRKVKERNIAEFATRKNFLFYKEDIKNYKQIKKIFDQVKPQIVIHLAAKVGVRESQKHPKEFIDNNITGTLNLLEASKGVNKFIFASSSSVYGNCQRLPFEENFDSNSQKSIYGLTKKAAEVLCQQYHNRFKIPTINLRFFSVYGPRGRSDMAPYKFVDAIMNRSNLTVIGDGSCLRDFTYIDDIINGIISSINLHRPFEIINLGTGISTSVNKLIEIIEKLTKLKTKIVYKKSRSEDLTKVQADIKKAQSLLDYYPKNGLMAGMSKFINWYKNKDDEY